MIYYSTVPTFRPTREDDTQTKVLSSLQDISNTLNAVVDRLGKCESRMSSLENEISRSTVSSSGSSPNVVKKVPCVVRVST